MSNAASLTPECEVLLRKHSVSTLDAAPLGTPGSWGTAYQLADGRVLKVTEDLTEAAMAVWLQGQGDQIPTLFPRIDLVFNATRCSGTRSKDGRYYIVREALNDLTRREGVQSVANAVRRVNDEIGHRRFGFPNRETAERKLNQSLVLMNVAVDAYNKTAKRFPDFGNNALTGVLWQVRHSISTNDLINKNFGLRPLTGDLVIRDLGGFNVPTAFKVQELAGLFVGNGVCHHPHRNGR
jgi:hypothetical protein